MYTSHYSGERYSAIMVLLLQKYRNELNDDKGPENKTTLYCEVRTDALRPLHGTNSVISGVVKINRIPVRITAGQQLSWRLDIKSFHNFRRDSSLSHFFGQSSPSADSRRAVVSYWRRYMYVHK